MPEFEIINEKEFNRRDTWLWRYLDVHKFINFLHTGEIRFTRMDHFDDPLEGVPLRALVAFAEQKDLELIANESLGDLILDPQKLTGSSQEFRKRIENIRRIQMHTFVSCWFLGKRESMAMWNLYSNPDGVGVQINARALFNHFLNESELLDNNRLASFYGGKVHYQDFAKINTYEDNDDNKLPKVALRKDVSYKHEEEFRFVVRKIKGPKIIPFFSSNIDLSEISIKVVCHPAMPIWKKNNVKLLLERAGISNAYKESEIRLRQSSR